jgi:5'-3' exonuclease
MGIRGGAKDYFISKILDYTDSGIARIRLSNFRGKRIIIDWSNIAHRFLNRSKNLAQFINEFINLIHKFAREKIEIVFIFDGKPRDEKTSTIEHRKSIRHKAIEKIGEIIENVSNPEEDFQTIMLLAKKTKTIKIAHVNESKKLIDL